VSYGVIIKEIDNNVCGYLSTFNLSTLIRSILEKEGPKSLFRGLGPNLVGVAPSR